MFVAGTRSQQGTYGHQPVPFLQGKTKSAEPENVNIRVCVDTWDIP